MKKLYTTPGWKRRTLKRSEDELKKRQKLSLRKKKRTKSRIPPSYIHQPNVKVEKKNKRVKIEVPTNFSIKNNVENMLEFFDQVYYYVDKGKKIFFEMSNIKELTADAIIYMLSVFDYYKKNMSLKVYTEIIQMI
jgi:hypothetical protein